MSDFSKPEKQGHDGFHIPNLDFSRDGEIQLMLPLSLVLDIYAELMIISYGSELTTRIQAIVQGKK